MGESKRRQESQGEQYGKDPRILPWIPFSEQQLIQFFRVANKGAWVGIGIVVIAWVILRFIGPLLGLWEVQY
ncbi:hypothetical protein C1752_06348 [Acaryochloris thomasi RCC1774]|uniref:DUF2839 domain-containing protein n=1 Tax=Acaryochloris thomasi RCC1774 TaxID=1764569 RepID=A0A2W1JKM1_9CYAN|nr:DUF2839 domain-containing protein [Acaryochloris thomasi]PZD71492.1 hypothetical protein C1752_06348 [Acaryochloris thomasi RCC1774]